MKGFLWVMGLSLAVFSVGLGLYQISDMSYHTFKAFGRNVQLGDALLLIWAVWFVPTFFFGRE